MTDQQTLQIIQNLQDKQRSMKVAIGVTIGIIFLVYFFTFAMLVDKFPPIFFIIEGVTSFIFLIMLFTLNPISFALLKMRVKKGSDEAGVLARLQAGDVDEKADKLLEKFG